LRADELAQVRAAEAEAVAEAYEVQVRGREIKLSECPCLEHYKQVMVAKRELAAAKRHAYAAISAVTPQRKRKAA
jgi:hypothetical protein